MIKKLILFISCTVILANCGGGPIPDYLKSPVVKTNLLFPQKQIFLQHEQLGLIRRIFYYEDQEIFTAVGHKKACTFNEHGIINNCASTMQKLKFTHKIYENKTSIRVDLNDDKKFEWLTGANNGFILRDSTGSSIGFFKPPANYWYQPAVSSSSPHVFLVSTDERLFVLDNKLYKILQLSTPGIKAPLHIVDGTFIELNGSKYFVSLFTGRGGWPRSILFIHNIEGEVVYNEILERYMTVIPLQQKSGNSSLLLGGHGKILGYYFNN